MRLILLEKPDERANRALKARSHLESLVRHANPRMDTTVAAEVLSKIIDDYARGHDESIAICDAPAGVFVVTDAPYRDTDGAACVVGEILALPGDWDAECSGNGVRVRPLKPGKYHVQVQE